MPNHNSLANHIWDIASVLRGLYRPAHYERVLLPMTVLRRLDCVLAGTKAKVLAVHGEPNMAKRSGDARDYILNHEAGQRFHNRSPFDFDKLGGSADRIDLRLADYIRGFSANVQQIFECFEFEAEIEKLHAANILFSVVSKFADVDLHPSTVPNEQMGLLLDDLVHRCQGLANETVGDHLTPRDVSRLMVSLLFMQEDRVFSPGAAAIKLLDPACGTGALLAEAHRYLRERNPNAKLYAYGQGTDKRAVAIASSCMLMQEVSTERGGDSVRFGDFLTENQFPSETFDYFLSHLRFGADWKKRHKEIRGEQQKRGFECAIGTEFPRVKEGSLLFLERMWRKRTEPRGNTGGARLVAVLPESAMVTGVPGSLEDNFRKWLVGTDCLEAIVALPESLCFKAGIGTFVWIVTNRKESRRQGKVQLLDARDLWTLGGSQDNQPGFADKRRHINARHIEEILHLYGRFEEGPRSRIVHNVAFGYTRVTVERPLRLRYQVSAGSKARFLDFFMHMRNDIRAIEGALGSGPLLDWPSTWGKIETLLKKRRSRWTAVERRLFRSVFTQADPKAVPLPSKVRGSEFEADPELRTFEEVPLTDEVNRYFEREVKPRTPDAWLDRSKDKVGYGIHFNQHFEPTPRMEPVPQSEADPRKLEDEILRMLREVTS